MKKEQAPLIVIKKGDPPPCMGSGIQCRGCFGWPNMLKAAMNDEMWKKAPFCCKSTGLVVKVRK